MAKSHMYVKESDYEFQDRAEKLFRETLNQVLKELEVSTDVEGWVKVENFEDIKLRWQRSQDSFCLSVSHMLVGMPDAQLSDIFRSICYRCYNPTGNPGDYAPKLAFRYLQMDNCELRKMNLRRYLESNDLEEIQDSPANDILKSAEERYKLSGITLATGPRVDPFFAKRSAVFRVISVPGDALLDRGELKAFIFDAVKKMSKEISGMVNDDDDAL